MRTSTQHSMMIRAPDESHLSQPALPLPRRRFLEHCAAAGLAAAGICGAAPRRLRAAAPAPHSASPQRSDHKITRIMACRIESERWKVVGKNSHLGSHGKKARDRILIIETDKGMKGVGSCFANQRVAANLLGKDPLEFYVPGGGVQSPLEHGDAPLWDLVGHILGQPAWRLFGAYGPKSIPVYDGSIYFSDLEPEFAAKGVERILFEVDYAMKRGHRAFKIKVGRGFKWMQKEAGLKRDIEVVRAIRKLVGPDIKLMADSNNGFDLQTTKRFLAGINDELYFVEEMFPENVRDDLALRAWLRGRNWKTAVADGESARTVEHFAPYIKARALDVLQADIRAFGFSRLLTLSRESHPAGIKLAPHNWGSYLGGYMQVVLGRGIPNFDIAEFDPADTPFFDSSAFTFAEGHMKISDAPGCALTFKATEYFKKHKPTWVLQ